MKKIKKLLTITATLLSLAINCMGQENNTKPIVYFLADTVDVNKNNRVLEIGKTGVITYYAFFCLCVPPYELYPMFVCRENEFNTGAYKVIPEGRFISWRELSGLLSKHGDRFLEAYQLCIVEKLPDRSYRINERPIWVERRPITDLH